MKPGPAIANAAHRGGPRRWVRTGFVVLALLLMAGSWSVQAQIAPPQPAVTPPAAHSQHATLDSSGMAESRRRAILVVATSTPASTAEALQQLMSQIDAAWNERNWELVLSLIEQVIAIDPDYDDIQSRKYYAYVNYGYDLMTDGQCTEAVEAFRAALELQPEGQEAQSGLQLVAQYCPTPTATATTATSTTPTPTATGSITPVSTVTHTPVPGVTPTGQPLTTPITYTVQAGDTLYSLSRRYGTTVQAIMQANGMMTYYLRAGAVIWIPAGSTSSAGPLVHIVQPGETLYSIARQYNTTVYAIMSANNLTSYTIWAYRALYIPTTVLGTQIHVVMPGETLYTIAQRYDTTVPLIMLANNLQSYQIYVYQRLVIPPEGWTGWPGGVPGTWPGQPVSSGRTHVVRAGDTLYSIARLYGTTVQAIMTANGLSSSRIYVGTTLQIP